MEERNEGYIPARETVSLILRRISERTPGDMEMLGGDLGIPSEPCEHSDGCVGILSVFCGEFPV